MILQWGYRNDTRANVSAEEAVDLDRAITFEDKEVLEACDPDVPLAIVNGKNAWGIRPAGAGEATDAGADHERQ